jgi:hypothetical protein
LNDWIDIGVYTTGKSGEDELIYLRKHKVTKKEEVLNIVVGGRPSRAGIDPLYKLVDRHPADNTIEVKEVVDLATLQLY